MANTMPVRPLRRSPSLGLDTEEIRPRAGLMHTGQRVAVLGMVVSAALAVTKIVVGLAGHSTAVVSDGFESAGDVFASGFVLLGLTLAAKTSGCRTTLTGIGRRS